MCKGLRPEKRREPVREIKWREMGSAKCEWKEDSEVSYL